MIIFSFVDLCTIIGTFAGMLSLALYFFDKRK